MGNLSGHGSFLVTCGEYHKWGSKQSQRCSTQKKQCSFLSSLQKAALITIYIRCLPASAGAQRGFNLLVGELGEGLENAVKCPLQSRSSFYSGKTNRKVTNGEEKNCSKDEYTWDVITCPQYLVGGGIHCPEHTIKELKDERTNNPNVMLSGDKVSASKS